MREAVRPINSRKQLPLRDAAALHPTKQQLAPDNARD
jgi:hypothetical protein